MKIFEKMRDFFGLDEYPVKRTIKNPPSKSVQFEINNSTEEHRISKYGNEKEVLKVFLDKLNPSDTIYDIGASVGLYTITAASEIPREGNVYSFEPDPENFSRLQRNVWINDFDVELVCWALGKENSGIKLFTDGADGYAPSLEKQNEREGAPSHKINIYCRTLDSCIKLDQFEIPDVLKIDVEGAEGLVLKGAKRTLSGAFSHVPRLLFLETHPKLSKNFGHTVEETINLVPKDHFQVLDTFQSDNQEIFIFQKT